MKIMLLIVAIGIVAIWLFFSSIGRSTKQAVTKSEPNETATPDEHILSGLGGVITGAVLGSFLGIAGFGGAIAGTVPGAVVGGFLGYLASKASKK
jgi:hypothetical protein